MSGLSNLPPGTTDRMIEEQANGSCSACGKCSGHNVTKYEVVDHDEGRALLRGECDECGAVCEGWGRPESPDGDYDTSDTTWEPDDCGHGQPEDDGRKEL